MAAAWAAYQFLGLRTRQNGQREYPHRRNHWPAQRVLRLTGSTTAKNFAAISAPRIRGGGARGLVLMYLVKSGAMVKKGDVVARIDAQAMNDSLNDLESQIYQANADLKKKKADIAVNWENLQQTLRASKAQADSVKLDAAAGEIRTPIDAEELKLRRGGGFDLQGTVDRSAIEQGQRRRRSARWKSARNLDPPARAV